MPRDKVIKKAFEVADDGMQGVLGYFFYVLACKNSSPEEKVQALLPQESIQITHDWVRYYSPKQLIEAMSSYFEPYHARVSLISIISIFEGALSNIVERLVSAGKMLEPRKTNYKARLEWAFSMALQSTYASASRIPDLCLYVDHARRIRNIWMHNNGLFDSGYEDSISIPGRTPIIDPAYQRYKKRRKKQVPVILDPDAFPRMTVSHIELLHQLHDVIQRKYFDQVISYSYTSVSKRIEWHRLLIGV